MTNGTQKVWYRAPVLGRGITTCDLSHFLKAERQGNFTVVLGGPQNPKGKDFKDDRVEVNSGSAERGE